MSAADDPAVRAWLDLEDLVPERGSVESSLERDGTYVVKAKWDRTTVTRSAPTFREAVGLVTDAVRELLP